MRFLILSAALTITACAKEEAAAPTLPTGTYPGGERNALCIAGEGAAQRAGFVIYGADNANCSASGRIEAAGDGWNLVPAGDADCKIPVTVEAGRVSLGRLPPACAYYCGPGISADGKSFGPTVEGPPPSDLAGDSLC